MKTSKVFAAAVAALTVASGILSSAAPVAADSVSDAKSAISANKSKSAQILAQIEAANSKVIALDAKVSAKNNEISAAQTKISDTQDNIDGLKTKIDKQQKEIAARKQVMAQQLVSLQKQAGSSVTGNVYVDFMLKSDNLSDMIARGVAVNKLNQANKDAMDDVKSAQAKMSDLKDQQEKALSTLESTKDKLESDKTSLVSLSKSAKKETKNLQDILKANKSLLGNLQDKFNKATAAADKAAADKKAAAAAAKSAKTVQLSASVSASGAAGGSYSSSGNTYPWGQCTWYAKQRSGWAGNGWGNGAQWGASAAAQGFTVNHTPAAGSLVVFGAGQMVGNWQADPAYGHVAYVESVSGDSITISQGGMGFGNPAGPNTQTISGAGNFSYVHPK
ncbi:CHAP domain-containing protein [Lacticaseibacillus pabuli]|uniref:CHAP domain-containing protein n=1 Tax=Lacticaseibacillus pabuli TaxID=3025672 RepID=A0ABY7WSK5_9LACO|nr:CHAP domain-containing protein [Lacticaseibacillus sp. KACC 23028]WDF83159.1 CHAP domain-containing protein [Lacticaseibacillus sp. KACC 23028]